MPLKAAYAKEQYVRLFISLLCSLFCCRIDFVLDPANNPDGSWMWALNRAIHDGRVFGRDFVFTYGPLGFLSSRNTEYIGNWPLLLGDILLFAGFFYFVYKYVASHKWWWPLLLGATIVMRHAFYVQVLFTLFIVYTSAVVTDKRTDRLCMLFCSLYGVMLFFIKINYGLISIVLLLFVAIIVALRDLKNAGILFGLSASIFLAIYAVVNIDVAGYVRYSLPLISDYEEAMFSTIDIAGLPYKAAMYFLIVTGLLVCVYQYKLFRTGRNSSANVFFLMIVMLFCFLAYRSGFTRYDYIHYEQFFTTFPLFFISAVAFTGSFRNFITYVVALSFVVLSFWSILGADAKLSNISANRVLYWVSVGKYYSGILGQPSSINNTGNFLSESKVKNIGAARVDILPNEIYFVAVSGLNYDPRPVPQSYSVYSGALDKLNANHFIKSGRPDRVLIRNSGIEYSCYYAWDEAFTKAAIHLNYEFETEMSDADTITTANDEQFMLFRAKAGVGRFPVFEKVSELPAHIGDTVWIPHDNGVPLYMSADVRYRTLGQINKLLLQPMPICITFITADSNTYQYRLVLPVVKEPVPISRLISSNKELQNFLSGNNHLNKEIRAFVISTHNQEIKRDIRVSFYRFRNY